MDLQPGWVGWTVLEVIFAVAGRPSTNSRSEPTMSSYLTFTLKP